MNERQRKRALTDIGMAVGNLKRGLMLLINTHPEASREEFAAKIGAALKPLVQIIEETAKLPPDPVDPFASSTEVPKDSPDSTNEVADVRSVRNSNHGGLEHG